MLRPSVTLIVPVFNEAGAVTSFSDELLSSGLLSLVNEVVVIDDGSSDGTWESLQALRILPVSIITLQHSSNRGLGSAIRTGTFTASSEWVTWVPVDLEINLVDFAAVLRCADPKEITLLRRGSRRQIVRNLVSWIAHVATRTVFGCDVRDQTGLFIMPRETLLENLPITQRAISNLELIVRLMKSGVAIGHVEIPILPRASGASRTFNIGSLLRSIREFLGLVLLEPGLLRRRHEDIAS